jgi:hypothetical protein
MSNPSTVFWRSDNETGVWLGYGAAITGVALLLMLGCTAAALLGAVCVTLWTTRKAARAV